MHRKNLYGIVESLNLFIPPLSDKSITSDKLIQILAGKIVTLPLESLNTPKFKTKVAKSRLKQAILTDYDGDIAIWFSTGRLPSRKYLEAFLYSQNAVHPLLGCTIKNCMPRNFPTVECSRCEEHLKKTEAKRKAKKIKIARPMNGAMDLELAVNCYQQVVLATKSRHKITAVKRGIGSRILTEEGYNDIDTLAYLQNRIYTIDCWLDKLSNI
jgi:hypothetical protein